MILCRRARVKIEGEHRRNRQRDGGSNRRVKRRRMPNSRYCICNKEAARGMVECDYCAEWYHVDCVGETMESIGQMDEWECPRCTHSAVEEKKLSKRT